MNTHFRNWTLRALLIGLVVLNPCILSQASSHIPDNTEHHSEDTVKQTQTFAVIFPKPAQTSDNKETHQPAKKWDPLCASRKQFLFTSRDTDKSVRSCFPRGENRYLILWQQLKSFYQLLENLRPYQDDEVHIYPYYLITNSITRFHLIGYIKEKRKSSGTSIFYQVSPTESNDAALLRDHPVSDRHFALYRLCSGRLTEPSGFSFAVTNLEALARRAATKISVHLNCQTTGTGELYLFEHNPLK